MVEEEQVCPSSQAASSSWDDILADPPWNAKSFMTAGAAMIGGLASWIGNYTSPAVAQMAGSYLGGFLIGWAFRRFLKLAVVIVGFTLACIGALKTTGWIDLDWTSIEGLKNLLTGFLPSAGAAGAGSFFGFRNK